MEFLGLGWRDAIMGLVAAIAVYMLVAILRLVQLKQHRRRPDVREPAVTASGEVVDTTADEPLRAPFLGPASAAPTAPVEATPSPEFDFGEQLRQSAVDAELQHLRGDLARVRDEVALLREEFAGLRESIASLQASRHVSAQYGEPVALAHKGYDARTIAERCGISIGEAELVVALARGHREEDEGDHDGTHREPE